MESNRPTTDTPDDLAPATLEDEVLMGRIVDGEADPGDQGRFEQRADIRPELWRTLALRQRDMRLLADQVERETVCVDAIELHGWRVMPRRVTWTLALSGWAAVLILGLTLTVVVMSADRRPGLDNINDRAVPPAPVELTAQQHLQMYQELAEWMVRNHQATLFEAAPLPDGSLRLRYMRQFDEEVIIDADLVGDLLTTIEQSDKIPVDILNRLLEEVQRRRAATDHEPMGGSS